MTKDWNLTDDDKRAIESLSGFIPDKVFDIHAHLRNSPEETTVDMWRESLEKQVGSGRLTGGLFFPMPGKDIDVEYANNHIIAQLSGETCSRGLLLVTPETPDSYIQNKLANPLIIGLKPYHVYSSTSPTDESLIYEYMPERLWEIAGRHGLVVMLHIVRPGALSDEENIKTIREVCEKHPKIKLVLAHAGRGFCAANTIKGIKRLQGLENVLFDSSAICESMALQAVLSEFGYKKLLWGSDFACTQIRGRCVSVGDGFIWLSDSTVNWERAPDCTPILAGLESLKALKEACENLRLSAGEIQDIFYGNAQNLLCRARNIDSEQHQHYF